MIPRLIALIGLVGFATFAPHARGQQRDSPVLPVGAATISGTVVTDDPTPRALRFVRVVLEMPGSPYESVLAATSDDSGRFQLTALPAGRYTLKPTRASFIGLDYGAERPGRPGIEIVLADGQQLTGVVLKMVRGAVITGRVTDQAGAPLSSVSVRPMRRGFSAATGDRTFVGGRDERCSTTDDRGIYRCYGLNPGEYVVMAQAPVSGGRGGQSGASNIRQVMPGDIARALQQARGLSPASPTGTTKPDPVVWQSGAPVSYAETFYPGTLDAAAAMPITLAAGEERGGLDFSVPLVASARIDGQIVVPEGVPFSAVTVRRSPTGPARPGMTSILDAVDGSGRFSVSGVTPGTYLIAARAGNPTAPTWWADETVSVDGRNLQLEMRLRPALVVSGKIVFEGASPPPDLNSIRVGLASRGGIVRVGNSTTVNADGTFTLPGITPDRYQLNLIGVASPWVPASSIIKSTEMLDAAVTIEATDRISDWLIRMTDRPAELTGVLQTPAGRPAPNYFIVAFSTDRARWSPTPTRRIALLRPASDGCFSTNTLPPGTYYLAALTDVEPGEQMNPAFLEQLIPFAARVTLVDGQKTVQDLKIGK